MDVGDVYKVRPGYTCFVGCTVYDPGRVIEVTDSNKNLLESQSHKLEVHLIKPPAKKKGRPSKMSDKMVRTIRSK